MSCIQKRYVFSLLLLFFIIFCSLFTTLEATASSSCMHYEPIKEMPVVKKHHYSAAAVPTKYNYPQNYFRSPLDIPLILSGSFGELRNNHFHAGLDCKTKGVEGKNIYSIADGYIKRIKVSPGGYGNALYVEHFNGYTSVYAHLQKFQGTIGQYVKDRQYSLQSFELDENVDPGVLYVKKGQVIAKSGNSGSSSAPHLHFEIRDSQTQEAINPLLFGYKISDTRTPLIQSIGIYNMASENLFIGPRVFGTKKEKGVYKLPRYTFNVSTPLIGLGIKAYDKQNAANNLNGIYSIDLLENGNKIYSFDVERISFAETRYINNHLDYKLKRTGGGNLQKCFIEPNNLLSAYKNVINRGIIDLSDGQTHKMMFIVRDLAGNSSRLSFNLKYSPSKKVTIKPPSHDAMFSYAVDNYFDRDQIHLYFPYGSFYNDLYFKYSSSAPSAETKGVYSLYHKVHNNKTAVQKYFDIKIKARYLPAELRSKAVIVYKDTRGRKKSIGGNWEGDFLKARTRDFGTYYITTDTQAPKIRPITIKPGKNMAKNSTITVKISDNLSGIKSYNGYVDGRWVLMEYDAKYARLRHWFDEKTGKGKHTFRLVVEDGVGNVKTYTASYRR